MSNLISFLGNVAKNVAGQSAGVWTKRAGEWAILGGHGAEVIYCCRNAARAVLGNNASPEDIQTYAKTLIDVFTK